MHNYRGFSLAVGFNLNKRSEALCYSAHSHNSEWPWCFQAQKRAGWTAHSLAARFASCSKFDFWFLYKHIKHQLDIIKCLGELNVSWPPLLLCAALFFNVLLGVHQNSPSPTHTHTGTNSRLPRSTPNFCLLFTNSGVARSSRRGFCGETWPRPHGLPFHTLPRGHSFVCAGANISLEISVQDVLRRE